jgi:hypothetical protein
VLGPKRLPEAGRALGTVIRDFRMAIGGEDHNSGAMPSSMMSAPAPPVSATPVSPAPEPFEAPPPPPPSGPPPPAAESTLVPPDAAAAPTAARTAEAEAEAEDATEPTEPARPFV